MKRLLHERPIIHNLFQRMDWFLELVGFTLLVIYWYLDYQVGQVSTSAPQLANRINFEHVANFMSFPAKITVVYILLTALGFVPRYFNYLTEITQENARKKYQNATRTIRLLKIIMVILFLAMTISQMNLAGLTEVSVPFFFFVHIPLALTIFAIYNIIQDLKSK
ncbi:MAG: hypothetical protein EOO43_11360 [Flavobacterium sp.]|nr:MAG: hypothetical protein EOO43_11360 [Flavobacterium sp.]